MGVKLFCILATLNSISMCETKTKICSKCGVEQPLTTDYYTKRHGSKDGFRNDCRACKKIRDRKRYLERQKEYKQRSQQYHYENRDEILEQRRKYYQENKEIFSQRAKKYYEENREKVLEKVNEYKKENPNSLKEWKENNKDHVRRYCSKYRKERMENDTFYKINIKIRKVIYSSLRRMSIPKNSKSKEILGCDWETFRQHIENQFQEGMTWDNHGRYGWHYDHHIPLASAETEEDVIRLNHYTNFKPLWAEDNLRKSDKISEEWGNLENTNQIGYINL